MEIIGLTGAARSGKSTVAEILRQEYDGVVEERAFADLIKASGALALGISFTGDDVGTQAIRKWADDLKLNHTIQIQNSKGQVIHQISGRQYLQRYGTEAHRNLFGPEFWIDAFDWEPPGVDLLVISDVRFENEAEAIQAKGGRIWKIARGVPANDHVSERPLDPRLLDVEIPNRGSISDLRIWVRRALAEELSRLV